jgi:hypothetical protein
LPSVQEAGAGGPRRWRRCLLRRECPGHRSEYVRAYAGVQALTALATSVAELLEPCRLDVAAGLSDHVVLEENHTLRVRLDAERLVVFYQPVVGLPRRRWKRADTLVRREHPQ